MTAKYNQLVDSASLTKNKAELKGLRSQLSAFKTELISVGKAGMTWSDKFKASIRHFAQYFSGASFIYAVVNQLRSAWREAKTLDDRLVDLQKVTAEIENRDSLYKYFDRALSKANELNVKVDSLIYAITEFKKLGWSLSDAELGGEWATMLSNVGSVDIDTAIGSIKTAIASFDEIGGFGNDQMDKKLEAYVDLINNMSNKYSIDAQGLSEAIRLSAGTLTEANTSIEQAATIFATANKYYNDPEYLGNTAKIGSLRLRATTGDDDAIEALSEMGEDIEEVSALTGKLREELIALTGVDIMIDSSTFKSYYDQLYEISQVIDDLDDTSSAKVLEMLFGKNRAAAGYSLLSGLQESEQAYVDAINSAGSATAEYEVWCQSASAATQRFSNSLTEMYQSIINGNTVRDIANMGSVILDFANAWGLVEGAVRGFLALKIGTLITNGTMAFVSATKQVEQYGKALQLANNIPNGNLAQRYSTLRNIAQATSSLTTAQLKNVLASQQLSYQDRIRILQMRGMSKEMAVQKLAEMNLTQATNAQTTAMNAQTVSTFSLKSAMTGLSATIRSLFLSNPVGIALMGISLGISAVSSAISKQNQKMEEMRDKASEALDTAKSNVKELNSLIKEYNDLHLSNEWDNTDIETKKQLQKDINALLDDEADKLDIVNGKYEEITAELYKQKIARISEQEKSAYDALEAEKEALWDENKNTDFSFKYGSVKSKDDKPTYYDDLDVIQKYIKGYDDILHARKKTSLGANSTTNAFVGTKDIKNVGELIIQYDRLKQLSQEMYDNGDTGAFYDSINSYLDELEERVERIHGYESDFASAQSANNLGKILTDPNNGFGGYIETIEEYQRVVDFINNSDYENKEDILDVLATDFYEFATQVENAGNSVDNLGCKFDTLDSISETVEHLDKKVRPVLNSLADAYQNIFADRFTLDNVSVGMLNSIKESIAEINKIDGVDIASSSFENFAKVLTDTKTTEERAQQAFNTLVTDIINSTDSTNFSAESFNTLTQALRNMGVTNAKETLQEIKNVQDELIKQGYDLEKMTAEQVAEFLNEANASEIASNYLMSYVLQKEFASNPLDTTADIQSLENLCNTLGVTSRMLEYVNQIKSAMRMIEIRETTGYGAPIEASMAQIKSAKEQMQKLLDEGMAFEFDFNGFVNGKGSGSNSKSSSETTFDHVQTKVEKTVSALNGLNDTINDTYSSWETRSNQLTTAITETEKAIGLMGEAYNAYIAEANKSGLSESDKKLFQIGAIDIDKLSSDDPLKEQFENYKEWYEKALDVQEKKKKLEEDLQDLKTNGNIELVKAKTDADIEEYNAQIHRLDTLLDARSINGKFAQASAYEEMKSYNGKKISAYKEQESALMNAMKYVDKNSEAYDALNMQLTDVRNSILELENKTIEYNNEIRNLNWDAFEYLEESISRVADKAKHFKELLSLEELFDDKGNATKYADATLGLHITVLETYKKQADDYLSQIQDLEKQLENGGGKDVLEQYQNMLDVHQNMISAIANERQEIIALTEKGYKTQLEYLGKIADKKKENLRAEKDLRSYERSIKEKVADKNSLLKQYEAYKNDTSEAGKAEAQRLKVELEKAEQDISDMEYDKMISETESMLDKVSSDYETFITEKLTDSDSLLQSIIDEVSSKGKEINETLTEIANKYGTTVGESISISVQGNTEGAINNLVRDIMSIAGIEKIGGYAKGTLSATKGLHRFNEKGNEIIIRKSDGSMLRNFDQGDVVISNEGAKFAENPALFMEHFGMSSITPVMPNVTLPKMPVMQNRETFATPQIHDVNMTFELPNVKSADDFIDDMIESSRFEKVVQSITFSRNPLDKYRYKR